jgi:hypothetical protein
MIRLFSYFVDWCAGHGLHADDYQIVIVPKSPRAEAYFKFKWDREFAHLTWDRPGVGLYDGLLLGVPFKIESYKS